MTTPAPSMAQPSGCVNRGVKYPGLTTLIMVLAIVSTGSRGRASTARIAHLLQEPDTGVAA